MTFSWRPLRVRASILVIVLGLLVTALVTTGLWRDESESAGGPVTPVRQSDANAPEVLWVGDSYTIGFGTDGPAHGYPCLVSDRLGWTCQLDAQGGTGFVNPGREDTGYAPLDERLERTSAIFDAPDLVVIDAGRNDFRATPGSFRGASTDYLRATRASFPDAHIAVILPFALGQSRFDYSTIARTLRVAASDIGATVIDTTTPGWRRLVDRLPTVDGLHPTIGSHRIIARHLVRTFRRLGIPRSIRPHTT